MKPKFFWLDFLDFWLCSPISSKYYFLLKTSSPKILLKEEPLKHYSLFYFQSNSCSLVLRSLP